jgi:ectoine hydroxylase-related dioxygenase (phytanoyl-CoA dioxygenase family)
MFDTGAHEARLRRDGFTIIEDFLDADHLTAVRAGLAPYLGSHNGRNGFEGFQTERVYTLVGRGVKFEAVTADERVMSLLDRFLQPGYLLTASQAINIHPGERAQPLHFDDSFYQLPRPRPPISLSVICAVDDFTAENGATELISGSHLWGNEGREMAPEALEAMVKPAIMPAGAALVFLGTLIHRGGANRSAKPRLAFTSQYCEPWARTQENFYLGVPRDQVAGMSAVVKSLLGYNIWPPFMGQVTASHPLKALEPGWVPPVTAQKPG